MRIWTIAAVVALCGITGAADAAELPNLDGQGCEDATKCIADGLGESFCHVQFCISEQAATKYRLEGVKQQFSSDEMSRCAVRAKAALVGGYQGLDACLSGVSSTKRAAEIAADLGQTSATPSETYCHDRAVRDGYLFDKCMDAERRAADRISQDPGLAYNRANEADIARCVAVAREHLGSWAEFSNCF